MKELLILGCRALAGGCFVLLFAILGKILEPKRFAGLFGAAPSVATASLLVTVLAQNPAKAAGGAVGMTAGAIALIAYSIGAVFFVNRFHGVVGSALAGLVWFAVAGGIYLVALR